MGTGEIFNAGVGFSGYFNTSAATFVLPAGRNTNGGAGISSSYNGDLDFYTYNGGSTAAASVALSTARRLRLNITGALVLAGGDTAANGTGITFPATQSASSDANTLDDYEEGTWTPAFSFDNNTGITYSSRIGKYTKIGRLVQVYGIISLSSKGSGTGSANISNLPFTASDDAIAANLNFSFDGAGLTTPFSFVFGGILYFYNQSATGRVNLNESNFTNTSNFSFTATYSV